MTDTLPYAVEQAAASKAETTRMRERADELAERIAESLWFGYQMARDPDRIAAKLEARAAHAQAR